MAVQAARDDHGVAREWLPEKTHAGYSGEHLRHISGKISIHSTGLPTDPAANMPRQCPVTPFQHAAGKLENSRLVNNYVVLSNILTQTNVALILFPLIFEPAGIQTA